ncbi:hypothetical protein RCL1_005039 [Eukaryota sp. TZLM3-RCL]
MSSSPSLSLFRFWNTIRLSLPQTVFISSFSHHELNFISQSCSSDFALNFSKVVTDLYKQLLPNVYRLEPSYIDSFVNDLTSSSDIVSHCTALLCLIFSIKPSFLHSSWSLDRDSIVSSYSDFLFSLIDKEDVSGISFFDVFFRCLLAFTPSVIRSNVCNMVESKKFVCFNDHVILVGNIFTQANAKIETLYPGFKFVSKKLNSKFENLVQNFEIIEVADGDNSALIKVEKSQNLTPIISTVDFSHVSATHFSLEFSEFSNFPTNFSTPLSSSFNFSSSFSRSSTPSLSPSSSTPRSPMMKSLRKTIHHLPYPMQNATLGLITSNLISKQSGFRHSATKELSDPQSRLLSVDSVGQLSSSSFVSSLLYYLNGKISAKNLIFQDFSNDGVIVRLFDSLGRPQSIMIDNSFPFSSNGDFLLSLSTSIKCRHFCLCVAYLEVAFSQLYGGFGILRQLNFSEVFASLTGGFVREISNFEAKFLLLNDLIEDSNCEISDFVRQISRDCRCFDYEVVAVDRETRRFGRVLFDLSKVTVTTYFPTLLSVDYDHDDFFDRFTFLVSCTPTIDTHNQSILIDFDRRNHEYPDFVVSVDSSEPFFLVANQSPVVFDCDRLYYRQFQMASVPVDSQSNSTLTTLFPTDYQYDCFSNQVIEIFPSGSYNFCFKFFDSNFESNSVSIKLFSPPKSKLTVSDWPLSTIKLIDFPLSPILSSSNFLIENFVNRAQYRLEVDCQSKFDCEIKLFPTHPFLNLTGQILSISQLKAQKSLRQVKNTSSINQNKKFVDSTTFREIQRLLSPHSVVVPIISDCITSSRLLLSSTVDFSAQLVPLISYKKTIIFDWNFESKNLNQNSFTTSINFPCWLYVTTNGNQNFKISFKNENRQDKIFRLNIEGQGPEFCTKLEGSNQSLLLRLSLTLIDGLMEGNGKIVLLMD